MTSGEEGQKDEEKRGRRRRREGHTELFQHLVTLIKDEVFDMLQIQCLISAESQDPTRCPHYNMRTVGLQRLLIFLDADSSEED